VVLRISDNYRSRTPSRANFVQVLAGDPYTDPVTGVLLNKLGLGTAAELEAAEREITHAALILLGGAPVRPGYDLLHLCAIHRRIFGDIYDWAGQIRTVGIAKGSLFCLPQHIETSAAEIFRALRSENCLRDLDREAFVARLAYYLGEVNAVHPFREGNGRTQRAFFEQLSRDAGYTLACQHLDAARNIEASAAIKRGESLRARGWPSCPPVAADLGRPCRPPCATGSYPR
jgi:cell filamentation protein